MTTNHQRFACEVNTIEQQRRCGINPADAVWRAQQCIPDEYDSDDPAFDNLPPDDLDRVLDLYLVIDELLATNSSDAELGRRVREFMQA